tara:strand:+ start:3828 stop:4370 length:543 start_codon:yes stop_codon:yes gene_type:complete
MINTNEKKKKLVIKKNKLPKPLTNKKDIEKKIVKETSIKELELDYISDDDDFSEISKKDKINFELLKKLTLFNKNTEVKNLVNEIVSDDSESDNEDINNNLIKDCDIDFESIIKDTISGKTIYYDYNKNIIYGSNYKIIGEINEDGEINLDDDIENDYEELKKSEFSDSESENEIIDERN